MLVSINRLPAVHRRAVRHAQRIASKMQVRPLRLRLLRARATPAEFLFEQAESFFDLLALPVMSFHGGAIHRHVVGHKVAPPVFDDAHLVTDLSESADRPPKAMRPPLAHRPPVKETIAFQARDLLPAQFGGQVQPCGSRVPTVKKHIFRAHPAPPRLAQ